MKGAGDTTSKNRDRMKEATDWFKNMSPGKMMDSAKSIVTTAVDVLEEEIAAGILAAKRIEKKVINPGEINTNPEDLMSRIRRDTHEAVDIFLDALTALTNHVTNLTASATNGKQASETEKSPAGATENEITVIENEGLAKAGTTVVLSLALANNNGAIKKIILQKPDLAGPQNKKILARHISVEPMTITLKPGSHTEAVLKIKIPKTCKPGTYSGLLCDVTNTEVRTVININIG